MSLTKICIADDHAGVRKSFITTIKNEIDCSIIAEGNNGKELLDALQCTSATADIAIIDLAMPIMNGYDTIINIKTAYPTTKILMIAYSIAPDALQHLFNIGINGFISKAGYQRY